MWHKIEFKKKEKIKKNDSKKIKNSPQKNPQKIKNNKK